MTWTATSDAGAVWTRLTGLFLLAGPVVATRHGTTAGRTAKTTATGSATIPPANGSASAPTTAASPIRPLGNNGLDGHLPAELGKLDYLMHLYLGCNRITGEIPPEFANLRNLRILDFTL